MRNHKGKPQTIPPKETFKVNKGPYQGKALIEKTDLAARFDAASSPGLRQKHQTTEQGSGRTRQEGAFHLFERHGYGMQVTPDWGTSPSPPLQRLESSTVGRSRFPLPPEGFPKYHQGHKESGTLVPLFRTGVFHGKQVGRNP